MHNEVWGCAEIFPCLWFFMVNSCTDLPWVPEAFSWAYYTPVMFLTFAPREEPLGKSEIPLIALSQLQSRLYENIQNLDVTLIGQKTKERITWVMPESGNLDTIWIFSLWNLWKPRSLLHIALESSSLQGFYTFKMYERWLYSRCYSLFVAGKKRLGTVCIQRRKNMCKFSTFTGNMRQTILFQRVLQNFSSVL